MRISKTNIFLYAVLILPAMVSCSPQKKLLKEADELNRGGLTNQAYARYELIWNNYSNTAALISMKSIAEKELKELVSAANQQCLIKDYDTALKTFEQAFAFHQSKQSLELKLPPQTTDNYNTCKNNYLEELRTKAESAVYDGDYTTAHQIIGKIYSVDRNYKQAAYLELICEIMPHYKAGIKSMELGLYREAYYSLNEVCKLDADFRDAREMRDLCLKKASYSIVYRIKQNSVSPITLNQSLAAGIKSEILKGKNPFIEILERDELDVILQEQQESMRPEFENESGAEAGKLRRTRYILTGEILNYTLNTTPEQTRKCNCASTFNIYSDKVDCFEQTQQRSIKANFKIQLLDSETGKLYLTEIIPFNYQDDSKLFSYEVRRKISLTSPGLTKEHEVNLSGLKNPVQNDLESSEEMQQKFIRIVSTEVSKIMDGFRP